ncbi:MAG: hypothetical protein KDB00_05965 [Planctomycetales bacterium]|nr:hypothetical protein [Planctomycetales bacterium]
MKASEFCYWLQGHFELLEGDSTHPGTMTRKQCETIKRHLALVFKHELDATHGDAKHQDELDAIHNGTLPGDMRMRC